MADTKNPGPLLVSYGAGDINALPTEWRAKMGFRQEDQQMPLGYVLPTNGGDPPEPAPLVISENRLIQTRTDERKRTSVTLNPPPSNGGTVPPGGGPPDSWTLVSEERLPWGQVATRTRAFVPDGSHLVLTDDMLTAEQRNLGIGLDQVVLTAPLPGPSIVDTKFDDTAALVRTAKSRKLISNITDGENIIGTLWTQVTHVGETATVASEVIVSRTLPGPTLPSTRFDQNSVLVTINKTKKITSAIIEGETVTPTLWTKTYGDGETALISTEIVEQRTLPGPTIISSRFDNDNTLVLIFKTQKKADQFTDGETLQGFTWTRTTREGETGLVATEVKEVRNIPGPAIVGYRLDSDGAIVTVTKTKKQIANIVEGEVVTPTSWTRTYSEAENVLIATEVVEQRALGANAPSVVTSHYDTDNTLVTVTKTKQKFDQFNDSESYDNATHIWTRVTREGVSEQVVEQVVESRTLPGQAVTSYRIDDDGALVTIVKTKKLLALIFAGEDTSVSTVWKKTYAEGQTQLFATEVVETRSLGSPTVQDFRLDTDGAIVTISKIKKRIGDITEVETATTALWTKVSSEAITAKVATEITQTRPLGALAPTVRSSKLDRDGLVINVTKNKKQATSIVDPVESGDTASWTKTYREDVDGTIATEVVETAKLPGPDVVTTRMEADGRFTTITKSRRFYSSIVSSETVLNNTWTRTYKEGESGKLATQVIESRSVVVDTAHVVKSAHVDPDLEIVAVTKSTKADSAIVPSATIAGTTLTTVEKRELTDLVAEEVKSVKPTFDPAKYGWQLENPLPPQYRSLGIIQETTNLVAGQAVVPPALLTNELEKSQEQVNALQLRKVTKSISIATLPVTYTGKEILPDFGRVLVSTEQKLALSTDTSVDISLADVTDALIVKDVITRYGGFKIRDKATMMGAFAILKGGNVDPEFPFIYNYTEQVVATSTLPVSTIVNGTITEIKPIDAARSLKRVTTIPTGGTGLDNINKFKLVFPGVTDVSIPPQLLSLTPISAGQAGGTGVYSSSGSYNIVNQGSGQLDIRGDATANAASMMDVIPVIKQIWGQNIACTHYLFFIAGPVISYASVLTKLRSADVANNANILAWPKFQPQSITITIVGQRVDGRAQADQHLNEATTADYLGNIRHGGSSRVSGSGISSQVEYTVKTMTIPPTIHAGISMTGTAINSATYNAVATISTSGYGTTTNAVGCLAHAFVTPISFVATGGQTVIPASGLYLHRMKVEPWKFGYFKCDCEVVDATAF